MRPGALPAQANASNLLTYARGVLAECDAVPSSQIEKRRLAFPFVDVVARFTDPAYAAACDQALVMRPGNSQPSEEVRLTIADAAFDGISPPALWEESDFELLEFERLLAAAKLHGTTYCQGRIWEFYDSCGKIGASVAPAQGAYPPWERSAPLRALIHWIYLGMGLRLVHAGTLGINDRGVLIAGVGGAGKSGLTLAGVRAGLDSVGDDYVVLDTRLTPTVYPVFRYAKQDDAGCRRLGLSGLIEDLGHANWQGKFEFDFERLGRGRRAESMAVGAILVANVSDRPGTVVRPADARTAMLALGPTNVLQLPGDRIGGARAFAELARTLPCYCVDIGRDPDVAAGVVGELLDRLG